MNLNAISHHSFDNFCYPLNKNELQINLKTGKDVTKVFLIWGDPFSCGILGGKEKWQGDKIEIKQNKELQAHLWWNICVEPKFKRCRYYFEIHSNDEIYFYCEDGFYSKKEFDTLEYIPEYFVFPWMNESDICNPPKWTENIIWYQIFPSRFSKSENANVVNNKNLKEWAKPNQKVSNQENYGGNLKGITEKLDYLESLGITGIYLTPINKSASQHKYDTIEYLEIDSSFGTKSEMKELVFQAHKHNMKVMLDGVFNHCGWEFFAWQDVLKNRENSKYKDWFFVNDFDFPNEPRNSAFEGKFFSFAFWDGMPKLNTNNKDLREYLLTVCETWVKEYDIDALRLDVANELSHTFCKELKQRMCSLKNDFYIIGEIWHNALPWLRGDEFDGVMNYPLENAILDFATVESISAKKFEQNLNRCFSTYYRQTNKVLFNQMDSHDTIRVVTKLKNKDKAMQTLAIMFALSGSACIYYGTEVFLEGDHDPDCRRCMPWKEISEKKYEQEINFMKSLISLRKENSAMISENFQFCYENNTEQSRIVNIKKIADDGKRINIILNFENSDFNVTCKNKKILLSNKYTDNILQSNGFVIFE